MRGHGQTRTALSGASGIAHCLLLRQRRWVRACAHDPANAQGRTGKSNTVPPRTGEPDWLIAAAGFRMTGKPNTVIAFAFTIGAKRSV